MRAVRLPGLPAERLLRKRFRRLFEAEVKFAAIKMVPITKEQVDFHVHVALRRAIAVARAMQGAFQSFPPSNDIGGIKNG
jgi:hypothetical protein